MIALAGFTLFEIVVVVLCILAGLLGIGLDRDGNPTFKWGILGLCIVVIAGVTWNSWTFSGIWNTLLTAEFWRGVGLYVVAGLLYSVIEFVVGIKRASKRYKDLWDRTAGFETTQGRIREVTGHIARWKDEDPFVKVTSDLLYSEIEVSIDKGVLHDFVWAWTFWWPLYALNMLFGRFLAKVFHFVSDFLANIGNILVRRAFKPIFGDLLK